MKPNRAGSTAVNHGEMSGDSTRNGVIRVLVADDQNLFRDGLIKLLSDQPDINVLGCTNNAGAAVDLIRKEHPEIILVGWSPNSPDAQKIFAAVQESRLLTRVILLAGDGAKDDLVEAVRHGCCGIVPKQTS